jgi:hypothetical protein
MHPRHTSYFSFGIWQFNNPTPEVEEKEEKEEEKLNLRMSELHIDDKRRGFRINSPKYTNRSVVVAWTGKKTTKTKSFFHNSKDELGIPSMGSLEDT